MLVRSMTVSDSIFAGKHNSQRIHVAAFLLLVTAFLRVNTIVGADIAGSR